MGRVLVATTLAAYVMDQADTWSAWLRDAEAIRESNPDGVDFFAAIEVDARGLKPFGPLLTRLDELAAHVHGMAFHWTYRLDDGRTEVTTGNRLRHITFGQNLANDAACSGDYSHLLFVAADCSPPADVLPRLIEVKQHVVAAHSPTYGLPARRIVDSPYVLGTWLNPETLCFSAACVMLDREAFRKLRWRWDADAGMSDDPCLQHDAWHNHNWQVYVRGDVVTRHYPECIPGIEHRGHDRRVVRDEEHA